MPHIPHLQFSKFTNNMLSVASRIEISTAEVENIKILEYFESHHGETARYASNLTAPNDDSLYNVALWSIIFSEICVIAVKP